MKLLQLGITENGIDIRNKRQNQKYKKNYMNPVASENKRYYRNYKNYHENWKKRNICHAEYKLIYKTKHNKNKIKRAGSVFF